VGETVIVPDTSYLTDFFKNEELRSFISDNEKPVVTIISYYEIMAGIKRLKVPKRRKIFPAFFPGYRNP
jgi:PIN domain nuclease of toxin-antitoxin system